MVLRLAHVSSHAIQYQAALFRTLAETPGVAFKAFFCTDWGLRDQFDPGFARHITWDVPLLDGYEHAFVPNVAPRPSVERFTGLVNPSIGKALSDWGADAVILHGYAHATSWLALMQCRLLRIPVLLRGDSTLLRPRPRHIRVVKSVMAGALRHLVDGAISIGSLNAAYWRHFGFSESRVFFAPYAVDNAFFADRREAANERAEAWRGKLGLDRETLIVGFASKLSVVKDCKTLIEAFGRVAAPGSALVIAGDGILRAELEALAGRFPSARIIFTGFLNQTEMPDAYALSDVFVLPSILEAWGLVINEAMNLARPVIVSDQVGCAPDLVDDDNGWIFPAGNVDRLMATLREAMQGPDARQRLRRMGEVSADRIARWGLVESARGLVAAAETVRRR